MALDTLRARASSVARAQLGTVSPAVEGPKQSEVEGRMGITSPEVDKDRGTFAV